MCNDILKHQNMVRNNIMKSFGIETSEDSLEKSFEDEVNPFEMEAYKSELTKAELDEFEKAKHQEGDMHPNGKWVWRQSANGGKGDWRVAKPSRGGGSSKTTSSSSKKTSGDFDGLSSAKTQLEVNKFWSNLLTSNSGKGQNIAGKLLDSIKESGYRNLSGGMNASGKEVYTYTNKDADKNIKIIPAIDGVVIKTNDKREVLKVSDFKTVSDFKKKFEETVLGLSGNVSNKKATKKPILSQNDKTSIRSIVKKMFPTSNVSFSTKDELIVEVEGKAYGDGYFVWYEWELKDGELTGGSYSGDTSKSRIDDLMKKLGKENLKKLKKVSLTESYD